MGHLALSGHMKVRVMAEDIASQNRKRYQIFLVEQLNASTNCIQAEFARRDEAFEFFDLMVTAYSERLILMADMQSRLLVKFHATELIWQCRFAGYLCYRGIAAFENGA